MKIISACVSGGQFRSAILDHVLGQVELGDFDEPGATPAGGGSCADLPGEAGLTRSPGSGRSICTYRESDLPAPFPSVSLAALRTSHAYKSCNVCSCNASPHWWSSLRPFPRFGSGSGPDRGKSICRANAVALLDASPDAVLVVGRNGVVTESNPAGVELFEAGADSELQGAPLADFVCREYRDALRFVWRSFRAGRRAMQNSKPSAVEARTAGSRCTRRPCAMPPAT